MPLPSSTPNPLGDDALLAGIRAGDAAAFETCFRTYFTALSAFAAEQLSDRETAEEVVQDLFVWLWEHRESWTLQGTLRAYLYTATRNRCMSQLRRRAVRRRGLPRVLALFAPEGEIAPRRLRADARLERRELRDALDRAIQHLPPRGRQAFELRFVHGLTPDEVAAAMGISPNTVGIHIGRALKTLRRFLSDYQLALLLALL